MKDPKVYIVIVNYQNPVDTIECLESVLKLKYTNFKIIVVDNSSDNSSAEKVQSWALGSNVEIKTLYPNLIFPVYPKPLSFQLIDSIEKLSDEYKLSIIRTQNNGFAAANNIVLNFVKTLNDIRFVWLLNNDTVVDVMSLDFLVSTGVENERAGIIGAKLVKYYSQNEIQGIGGTYNKWFGIIKEIGAGEADIGQFDTSVIPKFDYVIGASMFVSKQFLSTVGLLEEKYFLYFEELDWAIRGREKQWQFEFCHNARIYHKMGGTINSKTTKTSEISDFYIIRNRILLSRKYFPYTLPLIYLSLLKFVLNRILRKQYARILLLIRVIRDPRNHYKI